MAKRKRRSFTAEFKAEGVALCARGDRSIGQVARNSVRALGRVLMVSVSVFYAWMSRKPSERDREDDILASHVRAIFAGSRGTYGSPRVHAELRRQGYHISRRRVIRPMRALDLHAKRPPRWRSTTLSDANGPVHVSQELRHEPPRVQHHQVVVRAHHPHRTDPNAVLLRVQAERPLEGVDDVPVGLEQVPPQERPARQQGVVAFEVAVPALLRPPPTPRWATQRRPAELRPVFRRPRLPRAPLARCPCARRGHRLGRARIGLVLRHACLHSRDRAGREGSSLTEGSRPRGVAAAGELAASPPLERV